MGQDIFENLPSEMTSTILSRLPLRSIGASKCVCKPWLDVMGSPEFLKSYYDLRKFAIIKGETNHYKIVESIDDDELHWDTVSEFSFPHSMPTYVSANGLLFLFDHDYETPNDDNNDLLICNPITREYIKLPSSVPRLRLGMLHITYGFGVSRVSGQYKLVRLFSFPPKCEVYTLGTGQWRSVTDPPSESKNLGFHWKTLGVCCNGNLHWLLQQVWESLCLCINFLGT